MRLGELLKVVRVATGTNVNVNIEAEPLYGGSAFLIKNYLSLSELHISLTKLKIHLADFDLVTDIFNNSLEETAEKIITQEQFQRLQSYVTEMNLKIPLLNDILEALSTDQAPNCINIKLPQGITNFEELSAFNKRIDTILGIFVQNLAGKAKIVGFDRGSEWYTVLIEGIDKLYPLILGCINAATAYYSYKIVYSKSAQAKRDFQAAQHNNKELTEKSYITRRLDLELRSLVQGILEETSLSDDELNANTREELLSKLAKATSLIAKELNEGTEFHASLNPPTYVIVNNKGQININYEKVREINMQKDESHPSPLALGGVNEQGIDNEQA